MLREAVERFGEAFKGDHGRHEVQGFLRPIDTDHIARDLKLTEIGETRGIAELPSSDSTVWDAIEQQITQTLENEWTWHGSELVNNLRAYATRLIAVSVPTEFASLDLLAKNALTKLHEASHRAEAELGPLRELYIDTRDELKDFRTKNRLKRAARNPAHRWTTVGLLIVLISVEAMLNAIFFAKGSQYGYIGGVVAAVGISAVNIVVAFGLGLFPMRWINHRNWLIKIFGLCLTVAGISSLVALHAFAAHYRDATSAVGEELAFSKALDSLRDSPFILGDLNSYYLFGLGIVWAFAAAWKGYGFDDPYPRYGAHDRRAASLRNAYSDEHAGLFDDLGEIKEETVAAVQRGIQRIPLFPQQAAQIRSQRDASIKQFEGYEFSVEGAINQLLARYRDANRSRRKTPSPLHFNDPWRLPDSALNSASVHTALAEPVIGPPMSPDAALANLRELSREVLAAYDDLLSRYPHPTQMQ